MSRNQISLIVAVWIGVGLFAIFAFRWVAPDTQEKSVAQQWNEAIGRLGIEPIYPPQEDITVGDIFVIITDDALGNIEKEPLAGRALKLWHVNLTDKLKETYADIYKFPETPDPPVDGKPWKLKSTQSSVFKPEPERGDLPLVLFPGFTITSKRNASLSANSSQWFGGVLGGSAASETTTEVKISAAESYGLPSLVAEAELIKFCQDAVLKLQCTEAEARKQMSIVVGDKIFAQIENKETNRFEPRFSLEIALVSRVFLARSMHTTIRLAGSGSASASDGSSVGRQASSPATEQAKDADKVETSSSKTPTPGLASSLQFGNSSTISTVEVLQRPVAFGYRSVRWIPGDGK